MKVIAAKLAANFNCRGNFTTPGWEKELIIVQGRLCQNGLISKKNFL